MFLRAFSLSLAFALPMGPVPAAGTTVLQQTLDAARERAGSPGVSAAIMRNGEVIWLGTSGVSNRRGREPVRIDTLYPLASTTKMFVATTILRLYELGKLGLDEPIEHYVPSYVPDAGEVTIRELLGHTSGYRDVEGDREVIRLLADPNHIWHRSEVLTRIAPVHFTPGSRFQYCNTNYVMLGAVVQNASGESVNAAFEQLIARPVNLGDDAIFRRLPSAAHRIAHGYAGRRRLEDTFEHARLLGVPTSMWGTIWTDGGLAADARGVARFTDALFGGRVLQPATLAQMIAPGPNGSYGLGTFHMHYDRHEWQGHDGYYGGFTTLAMYDFSRKLTIVVLTNLADGKVPSYEIWDTLVRAYDRL